MRVRLLTFVAAGLATVALGACGSSAGSPSSTTLGLTSTNWATIATVPPTDATTVPPQPGDTVPAEQSYTVQKGDVPVNVAKKCGVSVQALSDANQTTSGYGSFYAGLVIKIPAGGIFQCGGITTTTVGPASGTTAAPTTAGETTTTIAGGASNCGAGKYTITKDDTSRLKVAQKFDVTVDQLDAANANTQGYSSFYPGLEIVIPPKAGCDTTTTGG